MVNICNRENRKVGLTEWAEAEGALTEGALTEGALTEEVGRGS